MHIGRHARIKCDFHTPFRGFGESHLQLDLGFTLAYNGITFEQLQDTGSDSIELDARLPLRWIHWDEKTEHKFWSIAFVPRAGLIFFDQPSEAESADPFFDNDQDFRTVYSAGLEFAANFHDDSDGFSDITARVERVWIEDVGELDYIVKFTVQPLSSISLHLFLEAYLGDSNAEGIRYGFTAIIPLEKLTTAFSGKETDSKSAQESVTIVQ